MSYLFPSTAPGSADSVDTNLLFRTRRSSSSSGNHAAPPALVSLPAPRRAAPPPPSPPTSPLGVTTNVLFSHAALARYADGWLQPPITVGDLGHVTQAAAYADWSDEPVWPATMPVQQGVASVCRRVTACCALRSSPQLHCSPH